MKTTRIYSLLLLLVCSVVGVQAQRAEYWVDQDPGLGRGTAISVTGGNGTAVLSTAALSDGIHILGIRAAVGTKWGQTYTHTFVVLPSHGATALAGAEWWIDTDPGRGMANSVSLAANATELTLPISTAGLEAGIHTVGARLRQGQAWGQTYTHTFVVLPSHGVTTLSAAEYWLDTDPGHGQATAIAVTGEETELSLPIPVADLAAGMHTIGIRMQQGDSWGHTYTHAFTILPSTTFVMTIEAVEAYWDFDLEHAVTVPFSQEGDSVVIEQQMFTMTDLSFGPHVLNIRAKADGKWGMLTAIDVCKNPTPYFEAFGDGAVLCQNGTVYIDDLSENVQLQTTYAWDMDGDGVVDYTTAGGFTHTYTEPGTYTITLTLTTDGCEASYSQDVTILSAANPEVLLSVADGECAGTPIVLSAQVANVGEAPSYEWLLNGSVMATTDEPQYTATTLVDGDKVAVRLYSDNPCATTPIVTSDEETIIIYPVPEIELLLPETIYTDMGNIILSQFASPEGGQFFIDDASRQTSFIRSATIGEGEHTLRYVVSSEYGCRNETTMTFTVAVRPVDPPTDVNTAVAQPKAIKVIIDDLLYIVLPDGTRYSATGTRVR